MLRVVARRLKASNSGSNASAMDVASAMAGKGSGGAAGGKTLDGMLKDEGEMHRLAQELHMEIEDIHESKRKESALHKAAVKWLPGRMLYRNPDSVPLLQRWWIPYFCILSIVGIWIPDKLKVWALYWIDEQYQSFKFLVHKTYWWFTMEPDQFATLMQQIEDDIAKSERVPSPDCPL